MNIDVDYFRIEDIEHDKLITKELRKGFIGKVYGILTSQILLTIIMCLLSMFSKSFFNFQQNNIWLFIFSLFITFTLPIVIIIYEYLSRKYPNNYIYLIVFTFFESYLISFICGVTDNKIVILSAIMSLSLLLSLTLLSLLFKTDLTIYTGFLFVFGYSIFMFGILTLFTNSIFLDIILSSLWLILFGFYLIYDTQLILGNKNHIFTIDDYILASFVLYFDIVGIFLNLIQIMNILSSNN